VSARLYKSGISLLSFCVGSFFFARFHRYFSPKRRWVLCASFAAQTLLIVAAAVIVTIMPAPEDEHAVDWTVLLPLALVAFQSCGQAVTSRALKYNALTSVVLTSIYCDLFSDQELFKFHNVERNRRAAAPVLLLFGAVVGGIFSHSSFGIQGALWTAAAIKSIMVILWFFWPAEEEES
jgi:MFS family permease